MFERINNCLFKISNVPADGNCFFHCLSYAIHHDFTHSQMYRNLTCQNVANEWDTWKDKVKICHGEHMSLEMYRMGMLNGNWWAGSSEIEVASALLNCEINIFLKGTTENQTAYTISTYKPEAGSNTVINLLLYRQHFQILERVIPDNINTTSVQQASCSDNTSKQTCPIVHPSNHTHDHSYVKVQKQQHFIHIDHNYSCNPEPVTDYNKSSKGLKRKKTYESAKKTKVEDDLYHICRKLGIWYDNDNAVKTSTQNEIKKLQHRIKQRQKQIDTEIDQIPDPPPLSNDCQFNKAMDCIRAFELEQMNYTIYTCKTCCESRIEMKLSDGICKRCRSDKGSIKMFSDENIMDPKPLPNELSSMTLIEQQLIARISPCIHIHMLKHGGIASSGHCVTFPQEINEPAQIFPRLPQEIDIVKVRKYGKNDTSKDFRIRRFKVQTALLWLQQHNPAYSDIIICPDRLNALPEDGDACNMQTLEVNNVQTSNDNGPAFQQIDPGAVDGNTNSGTLLPPQHVNLQKAVEDIVTDITMENDDKTKINKKQTITIPWPTRGKVPMSEFTTQYFFTLAFPCLFPYGRGDYHINRPITCSSIAQWADHLLWYSDGRFAHHQYFKFVVHNIIMRNNAIQKGNFIVHQQLGDSHMTVSELRQKFKDEGESFAKKIVHLSATLRGTSQYWAQRAKELRALTQYKITLGHGLPSFFATGSCAEFHFKPLRRLLKNYVQTTTKKDINLEDRSILYDTLQKNTHIVAHYFDLRTKSYFENVMGPVFGVDTYWYRQEFAKSRGMIHWHGLCWRSDKQPHLLMYNAVKDGLSDDECALKLEKWAALQCGLTACHPAGKDENGNSRQDLWPPPEGTAPQPNEENNPLVKLLMDASESQESLLEDYLLLTNRFNLHRCSDYCLKASNNNTKKCRMEFGTEQSPGKKIRDTPALVKDHNGSTRLEMTRDHPVLVQHSRYHTQGWRANGDISVILSKSSPDNPSVHDIIATEKYITGYACKGNQPTGAISNLFCDMINCSNDASGLTAKSICNKVLISTVKRDISAVEASYELSALSLYRSSHQFKSVNLSGVRLLEKNVNTATRNNAIDKYILRPQHDTASLYTFVCRDGRIPVFSGCSTQPVWPLDDEYSRTMLVLHWPNWRHLSDLKPEHISWSEQMNIFLCTEQCPNFVKADIDRVKQKSESLDVDEESEIEDASSQQPEWVDLMKPNTDFEVTDSDFQYNDGGENYNWNATAIPYPNDLGVSWIKSLTRGYPELTGLEL